MPLPLDLLSRSPLAPFLAGAGVVAVDVGARGGLIDDLGPAAFAVDMIGFEPEAEAHAALARAKNGTGPWRSLAVHPCALSDRDGEGSLHVTTDPQSSSLLEPDPAFLGRFAADAPFTVARTETVETRRLDTVLADHDGPPPSFLKIDVEGAELAVLAGAEKTLADVQAVKIEWSLLPFRKGQPVFGDLDA